MKILCFSDLHFKLPQSHLKQCVDTCEWLATMIEEHKPNLVVNLGDTNDKHGYIDTLVLEPLAESMRMIGSRAQAVGAKYIWMAGNHDRPADDKTKMGILSLGAEDTHLVLVNECLRVGNMFFLAASNGIKDFRQYLPMMKGFKVAFIHECVLGARLTASYSSPHGLDIEEIPTEYVIGGDIHHPQQMGKLTIVGAPGYHNWNDWYDEDWPRGCLIFDSDSGDVTRFANPHTVVYHTIRYPEEAESLRSLIEQLGEERLAVRVICSKKNQEVVEEEFQGDSWYRFKLMVQQDEDQPLQRIEKSVISSPVEVVEEYCKAAKTDLLKDKLLEKGIGVIRSCE